MIREVMRMMMKIWEFSPEGVLFPETVEADLKMREGLQKTLDTKQVELDSVVDNPQSGRGMQMQYRALLSYHLATCFVILFPS